MTMMATSAGAVKDLDLDLDFICGYETDHPDWSLFDMFEKMKRPRFTDLDLMSRCIGYPSFREFVADGFTIEDMASVIQGSRYLGFTAGMGTED